MDGMGFSNVSALETSSWKDPILILTSCFCDSSERFFKVSICRVAKVNRK